MCEQKTILGHTDTLVVCDAGLPVPRSSARIDMALTQGVPSFRATSRGAADYAS
jgi:D-ribose pyranose/furanose isomerase RbsD